MAGASDWALQTFPSGEQRSCTAFCGLLLCDVGMLFRRSRGAPWLGVAAVTLVSAAHAASYYVAPTGAGQDCTRATPCALSLAVSVAAAGDTVYLMDGVYSEGLAPRNSGTPDAWITFQADECALPIIQGQGESTVPDDDGNLPSGVWSNTASYVRFVGLVSRYWDSGFANGWTGEIGDNSNGHWEIVNCIADGNGRTGMGMYSASGFTVRESIAAHNGGNPTGSWSSGIQLYSVYGTTTDNVVERNVSFENYDAEKNNDGSGFIVDEDTQGTSFINNIGFRNGGSCMRLTRSHNTHMSHFTCFHNGQNPLANSPTNPGELYWTDQESRDTTTLQGSIAVASGSDTDPEALRFPPESGLSNNLTLDSGATPFLTDPAGTNPDFRLAAAAAAEVENLGAAGADVDIGFDPKCIVKQAPNAPYQQTWWIYSIDYAYIQSIGGVAQCFHPKPRTGGADLGAYELSGEPHAFSQPGGCVPDENRDPGTAVAITAAASTTDTTTASTGGTSTTSGTAGSSTTTAGATSTVDTASSSSGTSMTAASGATDTSGTATATVAAIGAGGNGAAPASSGGDGDGGCGCRTAGVGGRRTEDTALTFALLGIGMLALRRRGDSPG